MSSDTIYIRVMPGDWLRYFTNDSALKNKIKKLTRSVPGAKYIFFFKGYSGDNFAAIRERGQWKRDVNVVIRTLEDKEKVAGEYNKFFTDNLVEL